MSWLTYGHDPDAHVTAPKGEKLAIVEVGGRHDGSMANTIAWKFFFGMGVAAGMIASQKGWLKERKR
jgi:hypothetical protein